MAFSLPPHLVYIFLHICLKCINCVMQVSRLCTSTSREHSSRFDRDEVVVVGEGAPFSFEWLKTIA